MIIVNYDFYKREKTKMPLNCQDIVLNFISFCFKWLIGYIYNKYFGSPAFPQSFFYSGNYQYRQNSCIQVSGSANYYLRFFYASKDFRIYFCILRLKANFLQNSFA